MNRKLIITSWALNVLFAAMCGFLYFQGQVQHTAQANTFVSKVPITVERLSAKKYTIAIITPTTHMALDDIQHGFEETLIKKYKLNTIFKVYNGNGNRQLLRAQIEEVAQGSFDLVYAIGAVATLLTKEVFSKRACKIPIVFGAVAYPVKLGIVESIEKAGNSITGSAAVTNYPLQVDLLMLIKPTTKNVLLLYDPTQSSGFEEDRKELEQLFAARGVRFKAVELFNLRDLQQKVPLLITKDIDTVMILKDNTVVPAIDLIIKLSERNNITVFVTDLDSVHKGAALGFGVREYAFGVDAAACANEILFKGFTPEQVPVKITDAFKFAVNQKKLLPQGIKLDTQLQQFLKVAEFIQDEE